MKYTTLKAFEKHLQDAVHHLSNIYFILAKDVFICKQATDQLVHRLLSGIKNPELALKRFEGPFLTEQELLTELNGLTFFSEKQIFLIQQADAIPKNVQKFLEEYFAHPNKAIYLILSAPTVNRATNFYKKGEKNGIVLEIEEEKGSAKEKTALEWIVNAVGQYDKKIAQPAIQLLIKQLGSDLAVLHQEVEKLICYVGDRQEIGVKDITAICTTVNIETIWQLGEAIFNRNAASALRICKALLDDGLALIGLLRQLRSQFETDFHVCSIIASGGSPEHVTQQFPYMRGFILERHIRSAQNYGLTRFRKGLLKIDETELLAKSSHANDALLADLLIAHLVN